MVNPYGKRCVNFPKKGRTLTVEKLSVAYINHVGYTERHTNFDYRLVKYN
jgi:hypothetical protein